MQLNSEIEEKDSKINELLDSINVMQKKLKHNESGIKRANSKSITNNSTNNNFSRYNSAPLKSPIGNEKTMNIKEFMPNDIKKSYSIKANNYDTNTSHFENKKSIFNNDNFLNSSVSSLST